MSKVDCKNCQFYHNGRCEELGEYTTPGECECYWFAQRVNKKRCVAEITENAKQDGESMSKKCPNNGFWGYTIKKEKVVTK